MPFVSTEGGGVFRRSALTFFSTAFAVRIFSYFLRTPAVCMICVASSSSNSSSICFSGFEGCRSIGGILSFSLFSGRFSSLLLDRFGVMGFSAFLCWFVCLGGEIFGLLLL